ncbi:MAG: histidine phosphatase family protein [Brotaphodocola sp.]
MRAIYLIRHCEPCRDGISRCISQAEEHLSDVGREQAESLARWFTAGSVGNVYTSPQKRCQETAEIMVSGTRRPTLPGKEMMETAEQRVRVHSGLAEISVGVWDGLSFGEIKEKWPKEYEERGKHPGTAAPPGGESFFQAGERLEQVLRQITKETEKDVAILTHAGILRGWLCRCLEMPEQDIFSILIPFGSITEVEFDGERFVIKAFGKKPEPVPGPLEIEELFQKYGTPKHVQEHGRRVAKKAVQLAGREAVDKAILETACILHDLCRLDGRSHPRLAQEALKKAGYTELAEVVRQHHDLDSNCGKEEELLYLADKLIRGTDEISLEERFEKSREKCENEAALSAWRRRYEEAERLMMKYGGKKS